MIIFKRLYLWQGINIVHKQKFGLKIAHSKSKLIKVLNKNGIYQVKITTIPSSVQHKQLSLVELLAFLRAISSYFRIGLSLQEALPQVASQFSLPLLKYISCSLYLGLHKGENLRVSFGNLEKNFPLFFLSMIRLSSTAGNLEKIFQDATDFYDKIAERKKKLQEAINYPLFVLGFTCLIVFLILFFIIPMFQGVYVNFQNDELPPLTQIAILVSDFLRANIIFLCGGLFWLIVFKKKKWLNQINPLSFFSYLKSILTRKLLDPLLFAYAMHNLLQQAVSLDDALCATSSVLAKENAKKVTSISKLLHSGKSFYQSCQQVNLYWKEFATIFTIAEKTGDLTTGFKNIYKFWDEKFDLKIQQFAKILQFLIIAFAGLIIFGVFLAVYLPLLELGSVGF